MLGGWSISYELADYLTENHNTILELGSGAGSEYLTDKGLKVLSVEHNIEYINKYNTKYIYCPLINGWYDPDLLYQKTFYAQYDCLLVDGPPGSHARVKFLEHLNIFDLSKTIVIDDCQREPEYLMALDVATTVNRNIDFVECKDGKMFAIV